MKQNTCLMVDVWEGQLEIDEAVLKENGISGMFIRIDDMNGGTHEDLTFEKQWSESANFVRVPYYVYNPWDDGAKNFAWVEKYMPPESKALAIDIEVAYPGYSASTYAGEVNKFIDLCTKKGWKTIIYTGQGYLPLLSKWPKMDYWWAQYPLPNLYFKDVKTWEDLKVSLENLNEPFNANLCPGIVKVWQFTGDYLTLPGTIRKIDVNLFYGTESDLTEYFGVTEMVETPVDVVEEPPVVVMPPEVTDIPVEPAPPVATRFKVIVPIVNVRFGPGLGYAIAGKVAKGDIVTIYGVEIDESGYIWGQMYDPYWICIDYQDTPYLLKNDSQIAPVVPGPVPSAFTPGAELAYLLDDKLAKNRPLINGKPRKGYPATVVLHGGAGDLRLSDAEIEAVNYLNDDPNYIWKEASGWHNTGDAAAVKKIGFACNVVEVIGRSGNKVFVRTIEHDGELPVLFRPTVDHLSPVIHFFSEAYDTWADPTTDNRNPIVFLMSRPNEESYFLDTDLAPYEVVDLDVKVTTLLLNVRLSPSTNKLGGFKLYGQTVHVYGIVTMGNQKWGRTGLNTWIALYYGGSYLTDWRP